MAQILVLDDELEVLKAVEQILTKAGFNVITVQDGEEALEIVRHTSIDLIILDIIMPELSGFHVCRRIRADPYSSQAPILFLTSKGRPSDIAEGLDAGGDDYMTKPFEVVELLARVRALLRRGPGGALDTTADHISAGALKVFVTDSQAEIDSQIIDLTVIEHKLLHYLALNVDRPVSAEELLQSVWEYPPRTGNPNVVQVAIARLREKIENDPKEPKLIQTIRRRGYRISSRDPF